MENTGGCGARRGAGPLLGLLCLWVWALPALGGQEPEAILHALDYLGVDYGATVRDGAVVDPSEYAEQQEFAQQVVRQTALLPERPARAALVRDAQALQRLIAARAPGRAVQAMTVRMRAALIEHYAVVVAPRRTPDPAAGAVLYRANCAACHGAEGRGDGPAAAGLTPPPTNFHDPLRQDQRSVYGLYGTIGLGVTGTAMTGFDRLTDAQRWDLAFYVSDFLASDAERARGAVLWQDPATRMISELKAVTQLTPTQARQHYGADGSALLSYLRNAPQVLATRGSPFDLAGQRLAESVARYRAGDAQGAYDRALSAYLDGFELVESGLRAVDPALVTRIEGQMMAYRHLLQSRAPLEQVEAQYRRLTGLLSEARARMQSTELSPAMAFASALIILLREGLEALRVRAALAATLIRTERRDALRYFHLGWILALALGFATWGVSSYVIGISGASRELTEGVTALIAAAVLLYVGFWLHGKTHAQRWRQFVEERIHSALRGRTLWALGFIAFLAVYREVFETVLFYEALWLQAGPGTAGPLWAGVASGAVALAVLGWLIFRYSVRLPLRLFFNVNAVLLYVLAVVFVGHGIAALQEAGKLPAYPVAFPRISVLGIYPTAQTLAAQALLLALGIGVFLYQRRGAARALGDSGA
ncbi:MAG: cytochrome c/FTR1 family iron permease [Gammaproteobacteria bacterium]